MISRRDADRRFQHLHELLQRLGLPINEVKLAPPCKQLTCLGIKIDISATSLSIDAPKMQAIFRECQHIFTRMWLSKENLQSLLGKLIYLQNCVVPARIFINRMLDLFRKNISKKKIYLTSEVF